MKSTYYHIQWIFRLICPSGKRDRRENMSCRQSKLVYNKIKSLIYVSTTNIYWSIQETCFDLLTGHHQAIGRVSQRCCLGTGIPIFNIFKFNIFIPKYVQIKIPFTSPVSIITQKNILGSQYLNSSFDTLYWWSDDGLLTGRNMQPKYSNKHLLC